MQKLKLDSLFMFIWITLLMYGVVMVFSASSVMSLESSNNENIFIIFKQQLINLALGLTAAFVIAKLDYLKWRPYIIWLNAFTIILLVLVGFTPLGVEVNGATRWINIGFQFQPSELAKLVIVITIASMIDEAMRYSEMNKVSVLTKVVLYAMFYAVLIGIPQNHMSVVMVIILTVGLMLFYGGINKIIFFVTSISVGVVGFFLAISSDFRRERFLTFLDPLSDKMGDGYQITQNWYGLGSGELFGVGLGYGRQKFGWLPEDHTDFILGIVGEELGFIGILFLIILFFGLIARGAHISIKAKDDFGGLLVAGIIGLISVQVIINMAVISGMFPVTGMPLPFISYGGTSTIIMCAMMGIVFSVYAKSIEGEDETTKVIEETEEV